MIFNSIILLLFAVAIPLWIYRQILLQTLEPRARQAFRRLCRVQERAWVFCLRTFAFLIAVTGALTALLYTLSYIKDGRLMDASYRDIVRNRLYSGVDSVDPHIDAFYYDLPLPIVLATTCILLAVGLTLVLKAVHDVSVASRLRGRLKRRAQKHASNQSVCGSIGARS